MTVTLRMRLKGLLVGFILGAAIIAVIILAPRNPTSEEATIIYLAGVVFGLLLGLIQHLIMRNETYPIPDTPGKTASLIRWICLPAVIIIGVILALLFTGGFTVTPDNTLIIKTYLIFLIGTLIGAIPIDLTLDFRAVRYDFYRFTNFITGKKSE